MLRVRVGEVAVVGGFCCYRDASSCDTLACCDEGCLGGCECWAYSIGFLTVTVGLLVMGRTEVE